MIRTMRGRLSVLCTGSILLMASIAHSEVTSYNSFAAWSGASPIFTTLDFTSVGDGYVTDQYASLGAVFLRRVTTTRSLVVDCSRRTGGVSSDHSSEAAR